MKHLLQKPPTRLNLFRNFITEGSSFLGDYDPSLELKVYILFVVALLFVLFWGCCRTENKKNDSYFFIVSKVMLWQPEKNLRVYCGANFCPKFKWVDSLWSYYGLCVSEPLFGAILSGLPTSNSSLYWVPGLFQCVQFGFPQLSLGLRMYRVFITLYLQFGCHAVSSIRHEGCLWRFHSGSKNVT